MELMNFVPEALFIVVATTNIVGAMLKQTKLIKDSYIPLLLLAFAIASSVAMLGFNVEVVLQGICCWGMAVGIHQTVHQTKKK